MRREEVGEKEQSEEGGERKRRRGKKEEEDIGGRGRDKIRRERKEEEEIWMGRKEPRDNINGPRCLLPSDENNTHTHK